MIEYVTGNIFESDADCLVNTVNCEGYMGKGIAYQFKMKFPQNNLDYIKACKLGKLHIGTIHSYKEDGKLIVNFPTKDKWREKSKISYVEVGLDQLIDLIRIESPKKIALPPLGCGNGGLDWNVVKGIIEEKLGVIEQSCDIVIYEPSISYRAIPKEAPQINVSGLVLLQIRLQLMKYDSLRLQKSGFFVNYYLDEEYFRFDKWKYGPYSHSLEIVAKSIGEFQKFYNISNSQETYEHIYKIICSKKTEDKLLKLLPAVKKATEYINNVTTDKKVEGIATVCYIVKKNSGLVNSEKIIEQFKLWSDDKANRFSKKYINDCIDYLEQTGIIAKNICGDYEMASNMWN